MGILDGAIAYLAGPIDFDPSLGVSFRTEIISKIKDKNLNLVLLDPTSKLESLVDDVGLEQNRIHQYKKDKKFAELNSMMKKIVRSDLRCVDYTDFFIAYIDVGIHMCGSYHEMICALNQKKPVLTIIKGGIEKAPSWLFGILNVEHMVNNIDEMVDHLAGVNDGSIKNDKWVCYIQSAKKMIRIQIMYSRYSNV